MALTRATGLRSTPPHVSGEFAERSLVGRVLGGELPLDDDLGVGRNPQLRGPGFDDLQGFPLQPARDGELIGAVGHVADARQVRHRLGADHPGEGGRLALLDVGVVAQHAVPSRRQVDDELVLVFDHRPVGRGVLDGRVVIPGDDEGGDVRGDVLAGGPDGNRQAAQIGRLALMDDLLTGRRIDFPGRLRIPQGVDPLFVDPVRLRLERHGVGGPGRAQHARHDRNVVPLDPLEEQAEAFLVGQGLEHPPGQAGHFPGVIDVFLDAPQLAF